MTLNPSVVFGALAALSLTAGTPVLAHHAGSVQDRSAQGRSAYGRSAQERSIQAALLPRVQLARLQDAPVQTSAAQTPAAQAPAGQATPPPISDNGAAPDQTPTAQTPTAQTPTAQTPPGQTPADQTPADQTPVGQTPAGQTPAGQTPAGQAPAAPGEPTPGQGTSPPTPPQPAPGASTPAPQIPEAPPNTKPRRHRRKIIGINVGYVIPASSKTRDRFGGSGLGVGIGIGSIDPASSKGRLGPDLGFSYEKRGDNYAIYVPLGVEYRRAFPTTIGFRPYAGASVDFVLTDIRSAPDNVSAGLRTAGGGSVLIGAPIGGNGFIEARYRAISNVRGFDLSGFHLTAGIRLF